MLVNRTVGLQEVGGRRIFTVFTEPDVPQRKLVIMTHGFRGESTGPARAFVNFERLLLEDGFSCLRFDQPWSGNSEGDFLDSSFNVWIETLAQLAGRQLGAGYRVALLGQSMGATATMIAVARADLRERIPCIALWVPDAKQPADKRDEDYDPPPDPSLDFVEEAGQRVRPQFWIEAGAADFFSCLDAYPGGVHLVYGEHDRYVPPKLRARTTEAVRARGGEVMVLAGQDHSSWDYDVSQAVFAEERRFFGRYIS